MFVTHTINKQDLDDAVRAFKRAVEIDPEFVLAHSALGVSYSTYVMKGMVESRTTTRPKPHANARSSSIRLRSSRG